MLTIATRERPVGSVDSPVGRGNTCMDVEKTARKGSQQVSLEDSCASHNNYRGREVRQDADRFWGIGRGYRTHFTRGNLTIVEV
jgi:hypothetical protein